MFWLSPTDIHPLPTHWASPFTFLEEGVFCRKDDKKGTKFGGVVTGVSSLLFLLIESWQPYGVSKHEVVIFFEITLINLIVTLLVGILVKRNQVKRRLLKESEERYKSLVKNSLIGVFMIQDKKLVYVNPWIAAILGLTQEELLGKNIMDYDKEDNRTSLLAHFQKLIAAKEHFFQDEIQTIEQAQAARYLEIQATLTSINGSSAIIGIAIDVTDKKKAKHFAKDFGGNQHQLFSSSIGQQTNRRLQLEQRLRKALEQNHLEVVYQPKLNLYTNRISGVEALIRWNDPILGVVSPDEFIPIAEETGMIISIGKWVLEKSSQQNGEWNKSGYPPIHVCVNISSQQFLQDDFVKMVQRVLQDVDVAPEHLNLEITERIALYKIDDTIEMLLQLKQLGVSISLDDFGTGYSSLSYLKRLPIDYLKIDRSFINGIYEDKQDFAIIDSIISLSHSLGINVVAEGVEDELQLKTLRQLHCDEIQGYYYAKPMTAEKVNHFFDETGEYLLDRRTLVTKGGMK